MKRQATDQKKIFAQHKSRDELVSKIHKEPSKTQNIYLKTLSKRTQFFRIDKKDRYEEMNTSPNNIRR